jgi:hypothetical protein
MSKMNWVAPTLTSLGPTAAEAANKNKPGVADGGMDNNNTSAP